MRFLCRFRLRFLSESGSSSRNGDRPFHKNTAAAKSNGDQTGVNASRNNEGRSTKTASLGNGAGDRAVTKGNGGIDRRIEQHAIRLRFSGSGQQYKLANVCATAGRQHSATLEYADSGLDFRHLGLKISIVMGSQDVAQILRKIVSWHN